MFKIPLALRDFQNLLKDKSDLEEKSLHPIFYFEDNKEIFFYKIIGYVLYYAGLDKEKIPENIIIDNLIRDEFAATQLPIKLHITEYRVIG